MYDRDTIYAPVTVPGEGGVTILRVSGSKSEAVFKKFFKSLHLRSEFRSHCFYHGNIVSLNGEILDEVLAVFMQGPRSYSAEDVLEIHCHSNRFVVLRILEEFSNFGLRHAEPGEFTKRAFLNGRIDLAQAEAVADLIDTKSEAGRRSALKQLSGELSRKFDQIREDILHVLSLVEAYIDFPEEDIDPGLLSTFESTVRSAISHIDQLLESYRAGRVYKEGISVLVLGKPNVGKSSLLNVLLNSERAIVTDIPGTTRDFIEESTQIQGIHINLVDTAGIRETDDPIERAGVLRSQEKINSADLILFVCDGSRPIESEDFFIFDQIKKTTFIPVINKKDLFENIPELPFPLEKGVFISTHTADGIEVLKERIVQIFKPDEIDRIGESGFITDFRHHEALNRTKYYLLEFLSDIGQSEEFMAIHLKDALDALGEITGETTPDDILDRIFSKFCIGK